MFVTFRETWGFRTFMVFSCSRSTAGFRGLAFFAAIFPEVVGEATQGPVVRCVDVARAHAAHREEARGDEALQVVAQRGGGDLDVRLNGACARACRARLHDEAEHTEADRVPEGSELRRMAIDFRALGLLIVFSK